MCYIEYKIKKDIEFNFNRLDSKAHINKDGFGIVFRNNNGKWEYEKFNKWIDCKNKLLDIQNNYDEIIVHQRYATSGDINLDATHPVIYNKTLMVHNGIVRKNDELWESCSC